MLSEEERRRKVGELLDMIRELREPPPQPPPLVYRVAPDAPEPGGIGWQAQRATGPKG
jgi:hypothetical protein